MPRTRFNNGVLGPRQTTTASAAAGVFGLVDHQVLTGGGVFPRSPNSLVPTTDPYFPYVTALLPGDGTNGAQNNTFTDQSTNAFSITKNGNTTQGTFSPYGDNWSNYFDGTGDYLTAPSNIAFALGTGDFTVEYWFYLTVMQDSAFWGIGTSTTSTGVMFRLDNPGTSFNFYNNGDNLFTGAGVSANTWYHLAVVRSSNTLKVYVNGTQYGGSLANSTNIAQDVFYIGGAKVGATVPYNPMNGYISNLRVVKGTAVYTSNFTPSTTTLAALANTQLLTCQSNRFVDNSTNAFTITRNGDVSVQRFSPFSPTAAYASSTGGGSGYFDGITAVGDYLDIAHNSLLTPGGNFTIEFYAFVLDASGTQEWYSKGYGIQIYIQTNWGVALSASNDSSYFMNYASTPVITNAWTHVAVTRSGTTYRFFINGVEVFSTNSSSAPNTGTNVLRLGDWSGGASYPAKGSMSGVRFVNGTALYTANFTPPSTPPTAVANTQFLCNFTNAAIIDTAMIGNFKTLGQAQISTTQSKFGGSSMYFDGTDDRIVTDGKAVNFGTGDFTIEFWTYLTQAGGAEVLIDTASSGYAGELSIRTDYIDSSRFVYVTVGGITFTASYTAATVLLNNWRHWALVRSGTASNNVKLYLDGTSIGQGTTTASITISTNLFAIGGSPGPTSGYTNTTGYIDDFRITRGIARYTANFTPPTSAFPLI